jgi:hypothetical protein
MKVEIQKACEKDITIIAESILESSKGRKKISIFNQIFDLNDDASVLEKLKIIVNSNKKFYCHYSNFLIAKSAGNVVAILGNYESRIKTEENMLNVLKEIGIDGSYKDRVMLYERVEPHFDRKTWVLDFTFVDDIHILKELVQKSLLTARLQGYRKAEIALDIGAYEMKMNYEKLGFSLEQENKNEDFEIMFGVSGMLSLQLHL